MHAAALVSLAIFGQTQSIHVYLGPTADSLVVAVTQPDGVTPAPGAQVLLADLGKKHTDPDYVIERKRANSSGKATFFGLSPSRHPVLAAFAQQGTLKAQGVKVQWRLFLDRELRLLPEQPPVPYR
jgi:hypothetical protein